MRGNMLTATTPTQEGEEKDIITLCNGLYRGGLIVLGQESLSKGV